MPAIDRPRGQPANQSSALVERMIARVDEIHKRQQLYLWGGGHGSFNDPNGYDCSGFVSSVLNAGGLLTSPQTTTGLNVWGKAGEGKEFTVWVNEIPGNPSDSHAFMTFEMDGGRKFAESGGSGNKLIPVGWREARSTNGFSPRTGSDEESATPGTPEGGVDLRTVEKLSKSTAFVTYIDLPGLFNNVESLALRGKKSLMNDQPLFPFVQQLAQACLRNIQSLPNGDFFAFYPDYFGGQNHRTPYWDIEDIEILSGQVDLTDDALATHVYVVGDIAGLYDGVNMFDRVQTNGIVTVFDAFAAGFMNPKDENAVQIGEDGDKPDEPPVSLDSPTLAEKHKAIAFLRKYGARPHFEEAPMVRSPYYETFLAYQKFSLMWSQQFNADFSLTFMPEIYPGGIVRFPQHDLQMYVDEVTHTFDYETGFETQVKFVAPADAKMGTRQNASAGMVRAGVLSTQAD